MTDISDIEPYSDQDVPQVIDRLINDDEFIKAIGQLKFKGWFTPLSLILRPQIRSFLRSKAQVIQTIQDFQLAVEPQLAKVLSRTTETFTVSGLEHINCERSYIFLSNHRDIAMDPALVNWALHNGGFHTVRIAIGDNLVKKPFVGDLMRLNKSFIVKRNVSGPREMLQTYSALSGYIRQSLEDGHSIWLAHREGRAKDGIDRTDPAILKMIAMAGKPRDESFKEAVLAAQIVPVSISYEFDPCAPMKARELAITERDGYYIKRPDEDVQSIAAGIMGWKGRVHLHFGKPITDTPETPQELAIAIDHQIILSQRVFDTGRAADALLDNQHLPDDLLPDVKERFQALISGTPEEYRDKLLEIYANPLRQFTLHHQAEI
jgi:1-acyl-sn-glycerol-3-phosphate acyltransferase